MAAKATAAPSSFPRARPGARTASDAGVDLGCSAQLGDYQLLSPLGSGGMGRVFLCRQVRTRKLYALKLLKQDKPKKPRSVARFHREAQLLARLRHENIVELHDLSLADPDPFLVMEYIEGRTLREELDQHGVRSPEFVTQVLGQLCRGLAKAHQNGVIHRDLKPENIMLAQHADGQLLVKLLDFGVARLYEEGSPSLTNTDVGIGTAAYMSPEQARGERHLDARSDIFAVGALAYEMLTGRRPFAGASYNEVIFQIVNRAHKPLIARRPDLPAWLIEVVETALAKSPNQRFANVDQLLGMLRGMGTVQAGVDQTDTELVGETRDASSHTNFELPLGSNHLQSEPGHASVSLRRSPKVLLACLGCLVLGATLGTQWQPSKQAQIHSLAPEQSGRTQRPPPQPRESHEQLNLQPTDAPETAEVANAPPSIALEAIGAPGPATQERRSSKPSHVPPPHTTPRTPSTPPATYHARQESAPPLAAAASTPSPTSSASILEKSPDVSAMGGDDPVISPYIRDNPYQPAPDPQ